MDDLIPSAHLDVGAFARTGGALAGRAPLSVFARVAQDCHGAAADVEVVWSARGELRSDELDQPQAWLHVRATTELPLTCQRCLDAVQTPLVVDQWFRFVASEEIAAAQDDDAAEDLLVLDGEFNLCELLEDELVLALPLIPSHTVCPSQPVLSVQDAAFDTPSEKPNPFSVLAKLKSPKVGQAD